MTEAERQKSVDRDIVERFRTALPSHVGELTILREKDRRIYKVAEIARQINCSRTGGPRRISVSEAVELLQKSGRRVDVINHTPIHPFETQKPLMVLASSGTPIRILDGGARIAQAVLDGMDSLPAVFVADEIANQCLFHAKVHQLPLAKFGFEKEARRLILLTASDSEVTSLTIAGQERREPPVQPVKRRVAPVAQVEPASENEFDGPRENKAYHARVDVAFSRGRKARGKASATLNQKKVNTAIASNLASLFLERWELTGANDRSAYLGEFLGQIDRSGREHCTSVIERLGIHHYWRDARRGLDRVGSIQELLKMPAVRFIKSVIDKPPPGALPQDGQAQLREIECSIALTLAALGHLKEAIADSLRFGRKLITDLAEAANFAAVQPDRTRTELSPREKLVSFSFGDVRNPYDPMKEVHHMALAAFACGVNPARVWAQLSVHDSAFELSIQAGHLHRRQPAILRQDVAEGYLSHRGLALLGGRSHYSRVWNQVEQVLEAAKVLNSIGEQCLFACKRDSDHNLVVDADWPAARYALESGTGEMASV
jgi:hypothetical protein